MRKLRRGTLPDRVLTELERFQRELSRGINRRRKKVAFVDSCWRSHRKSTAIACVQTMLRAMASGLERCMFCEDSRGCDIEHREPRAVSPSKTFEWGNLLWACAACNRAKATTVAVVIDPTREDPLDWLRLSFVTGDWIALDDRPDAVALMDSALGRLINAPSMCQGRVDAYQRLGGALRLWERTLANGEEVSARRIRDAICRAPFSAVLAAVLVAAHQPGAEDVLDAELLAVLRRHREVEQWLDDADDVRVRSARSECDLMALKIRSRKTVT